MYKYLYLSLLYNFYYVKNMKCYTPNYILLFKYKNRLSSMKNHKIVLINFVMINY